MNLDNISVNKQSSIRISGSKILYFDAFEISDEAHDADYIFITHEHFDHFDPASIMKVMKEDSVIIAPESMKSKLLSELKVDDDKNILCKPNETIELDGLSIETVPAYNNLKPFHTKGSKWLGYLVQMDGIKYYVAGDTDVNADNKDVKCDVALIPIGGHYTMDKKQAAEFVGKMKPQAVVPTHYGEIVGNASDGGDFKTLIESSSLEIFVELKLNSLS